MASSITFVTMGTPERYQLYQEPRASKVIQKLVSAAQVPVTIRISHFVLNFLQQQLSPIPPTTSEPPTSMVAGPRNTNGMTRHNHSALFTLTDTLTGRLSKRKLCAFGVRAISFSTNLTFKSHTSSSEPIDTKSSSKELVELGAAVQRYWGLSITCPPLSALLIE
jgi:hypothetical protein